VLDLSRAISIIFLVGSLSGCGEPMFENAGSQHSLLEDRETCTVELEQTPAAMAYRQNPTAHPEYVSQLFEDMNRCIERKGWKQVRSQQEQEQMREAITSELAQTGQPAGLSGSKATDAFAQAVEDRLARGSSGVQPRP
jgi:primosomal protein N'